MFIDYTAEEWHQLEEAYKAGRINLPWTTRDQEELSAIAPRYSYYLETLEKGEWRTIAGPFISLTALKEYQDAALKHASYRPVIYDANAIVIVCCDLHRDRCRANH